MRSWCMPALLSTERALHEQVAEVRIAALADVSEAGFPAGGVLAGSQADPGGELAAVLELPGVAHGGDDGKRRGGPDAADLHQALRRLAEFGLGFDLPVITADALIEHAQLLEQIAACAAWEIRQPLGRHCRLAAHGD